MEKGQIYVHKNVEKCETKDRKKGRLLFLVITNKYKNSFLSNVLAFVAFFKEKYVPFKISPFRRGNLEI